MKDELTIRDFYYFLKDNLKIILGSMILLALAIGGYVIYAHMTADTSEEQTASPIEMRSPALSEERFAEMAEWPLEVYSEPQIRAMQEYLLPRAYKLTIYAEHENYEPIANTTFMREVFRNDTVLEYVEAELGEKLTPAIEFSIHIENLADSGVYELHFQRGTREESLELGRIVMNAIEEDVIPVLENKTVYFVEDEPEVLMPDYSDQYSTDADSGTAPAGVIVRDVVLYAAIAAAVGGIVGILLALLINALDKKITPLYDYIRKETDKVVRLNHLREVDREKQIEKGLKNINMPKEEHKVVLYDEVTENEWKDLINKFDKNVSIYTDFAQIDPKMVNINEVILLSRVNKTTKNWYNNQRIQLNGYDVPVKIIQF
ncbi:hypothetical protein [Atopococcus tabaci]|uniref:hypothetical protein n=1 Tax=Atopococcus tabaci TaxID=269774 RepID=UPI00042555C7|nr:hypothetical protein [Atopococcus tabaci]